jgi:hypothetical protein
LLLAGHKPTALQTTTKKRHVVLIEFYTEFLCEIFGHIPFHCLRNSVLFQTLIQPYAVLHHFAFWDCSAGERSAQLWCVDKNPQVEGHLLIGVKNLKLAASCLGLEINKKLSYFYCVRQI